MPRKLREKSPQDLYHIVFRGTNKQVLFESKYDYMKFLEYMQKAKNQINFEIHGYCLMSNHIHMLVKTPFDNLSKIGQSINAPYAHFYNIKYCRTGSLFEIRFGSIPILTIQQYMNTVRYIHQNPVRAGIISNQNAHKYLWSSLKEFKEYAMSNNSDKFTYLINPNIVAETFECFESFEKLDSKAKDKKLSKFFLFHTEVSDEYAYEHDCHRLTDQEAAEILKSNFGHKIEFIKDLQKMDVKSRNELILEIKKLKLSITQISRLTGIGRNIIQRARE